MRFAPWRMRSKFKKITFCACNGPTPECNRGPRKNRTLVVIDLHRKPLAALVAIVKTVRGPGSEDRNNEAGRKRDICCGAGGNSAGKRGIAVISRRGRRGLVRCVSRQYCSDRQIETFHLWLLRWCERYRRQPCCPSYGRPEECAPRRRRKEVSVDSRRGPILAMRRREVAETINA